MFVLENLKIFKHPVFGSINLDFGCNNDIERDRDSAFKTVIIGENGIGKSYLLRSIADIFNQLYLMKKGEEYPDLGYRFSVTYSVYQDTYTVSCLPVGFEAMGRNAPKRYLFYRNNMSIHHDFIDLPDRIIASSMTVADKFNAKSSEFYFYKGIRNDRSPSTTGTRTLVRKSVDAIVYSLSNKLNSREELRLLLDVLGLNPYLEIKYKVNYKKQFYSSCDSPASLIDLFENQGRYFQNRKSVVWGTGYFNTIKDDEYKLVSICRYLQRLRNEEGRYGKYSIIYNPFDYNDRLLEDWDVIQTLTNLDILSYPELSVSKNENTFQFEKSSSGETQQLCQFLNIMSAITENSLVLIDEPENSSHPNWQMQYIGWLQDIFHQYYDCHFVIATHSHFLLTNLKPEWSRILALKKSNEGMSDVAEGVNTFCWSVDEILYKVFHVRSTRNWVFEKDLFELCNLIENHREKRHAIRTLVDRLNEYTLSHDDPLNKIIDIANAYA